MRRVASLLTRHLRDDGYARADSPKFEPVAVRWLARFALEGNEIRLADVQLAAAALACLRGRRHENAERALLGLM